MLENAIKFGEGKPIELRVANLGDRARLTITDHGIGIAPEDTGRVFGKFERAVSERHYGGLGLGLWIASQLAEALGGTLKVDSRLGEGATFSLELPLA